MMSTRNELLFMKNFVITSLLCTISFIAASQQKVFDSHVHIWNGSQSLQEYFHQLDSTKQQVTKFAAILIARQGESSRTQAKNDELIELATQNPKLVAICSVHPYDNDTAIFELKRIAKLGVHVIKLHPHTQNFEATDERLFKLCELAGQLGVIVLIDNANIKPGDSEKLFDLAVKTPDTKFIFAHMGAFNFRFWNIIPVARTAKGFFKDNIYFDISASVVLMADSPIEAEFVWTIPMWGWIMCCLGRIFRSIRLSRPLPR